MDNPFVRPEGTEMIANICSFKRMEATINQFQPFKAPGPDGLYLVLLQKGYKLTQRILLCHFSSMPETQLQYVPSAFNAIVQFMRPAVLRRFPTPGVVNGPNLDKDKKRNKNVFGEK